MINMGLLFSNNLLSTSYTVYRSTATVVTTGVRRTIDNTEASFTAQLSIQAPKATDLQYLSDGYRDSEVYAVWTNTDLILGQVKSQTISDEVLYHGSRWKLITRLNHTDFGINGYLMVEVV